MSVIVPFIGSGTDADLELYRYNSSDEPFVSQDGYVCKSGLMACGNISYLSVTVTLTADLTFEYYKDLCYADNSKLDDIDKLCLYVPMRDGVGNGFVDENGVVGLSAALWYGYAVDGNSLQPKVLGHYNPNTDMIESVSIRIVNKTVNPITIGNQTTLKISSLFINRLNNPRRSYF